MDLSVKHSWRSRKFGPGRKEHRCKYGVSEGHEFWASGQKAGKARLRVTRKRVRERLSFHREQDRGAITANSVGEVGKCELKPHR